MRLSAKVLAMIGLGAAPSLAATPAVVVDLPVVGSLVSQVMGDMGQPLVLLVPGADAHDFQLRPSQAAAIADADLVIWIGHEMSPWLARALDAGGGAGPTLALLSAPDLSLRPFDGDAASPDPHVWFDPANAGAWVDAIALALAAEDPEHAAIYQNNATAARREIAATDAKVRLILAPAAGVPLLMFHDAFGYFAATYGLTIAATVEEGDAAEPGAQHIAALRTLVGAGGAVCAFPEANQDPAFLTTVAEGLDLRIGTALDPEAVTLEPGAGLYDALMTATATAIAACAAR